MPYHIMLSIHHQHPLPSSNITPLSTTMNTMDNMTMRAALYNATPYTITTPLLPRPVLDPQNHTSALLRITTSAICGSDLHIYHGLQGNDNPPWVMGHEAVGVVEYRHKSFPSDRGQARRRGACQFSRRGHRPTNPLQSRECISYHPTISISE